MRGEKEYLHYTDPAKARINGIYARRSVAYTGRSYGHVILDTKHAVTSSHLIENGVPPENIWAPNINSEDCNGLEKFGVNAPQVLLDEFINSPPGNIRSMWADTMSSISGGGAVPTYAVAILDKFLLENRGDIGQRCFFAVTLTTRDRNGRRTIYGKCTTTFREQVKRLAQRRGFTIGARYSEVYRKNQWYAHWELKYDPAVVAGKKQKPLYNWRWSKNHIVGCPPGYKI